jgi:hypothetical protein
MARRSKARLEGLTPALSQGEFMTVDYVRVYQKVLSNLQK